MALSGAIGGLGTRASFVYAVPDAHRRGLSPDEAKVVEAAGSGQVLGEVIRRCGLPEARAIAVLIGLRLRGIINPGTPRGTTMPATGAGSPPPPGAAAAGAGPARATSTTSGAFPRPGASSSARISGAFPRAGKPGPQPASSRPGPILEATRTGPVAVDLRALDEDVELEEERKREVLEYEVRCNSEDHFKVLGLPPGADGAAAKRAFYELSRRFHPDRYFGKKLGSYKVRIERIFRRLNEAQVVLSDPEKRAAFLAAHPEWAGTAARPAVTIDPARAAERRARLARHPFLASKSRMVEVVHRARQAIEQGDFARAVADLTVAAQKEPQNREIAQLLARARQGSNAQKAEAELKNALNAEQLGDRDGALKHLRSAVELAPDGARYAHELATRLLTGGDAEVREAHALARRASELEPNNIEYRLTFARALARAGLEKNAVREYETILKQHPGHPEASDALRRLRRKL